MLIEKHTDMAPSLYCVSLFCPLFGWDVLDWDSGVALGDIFSRSPIWNGVSLGTLIVLEYQLFSE